MNKKNLLVAAIGGVVSSIISVSTACIVGKKKYKQGLNDGAICILTMYELDEALKQKNMDERSFLSKVKKKLTIKKIES